MKIASIVIVGMFVIAGCSGLVGKQNTNNAKKITNGMTEAQVTETLGKPHSQVSKGKLSHWYYSLVNSESVGNLEHSVFFKNGKVIRHGRYKKPPKGLKAERAKGLLMKASKVIDDAAKPSEEE